MRPYDFLYLTIRMLILLSNLVILLSNLSFGRFTFALNLGNNVFRFAIGCPQGEVVK